MTGNIIPALATTTSVVAGLVTQEVLKFASERVLRRQFMERQHKISNPKKHPQNLCEDPVAVGVVNPLKPPKNRLPLLPSFGLRSFLSLRKKAKTMLNVHSKKENKRKKRAAHFSTHSYSPISTLERQHSDSDSELPVLDKSYLLREKDRILGKFSNSFINLALPMLAFTQPVQPVVFRITDKLSYTEWDSIQVKIKSLIFSYYYFFLLS